MNKKTMVAILSLVLGVMLCVGAVFAVSIWYVNKAQRGNSIKIGEVQTVAVEGTAIEQTGIMPGAEIAHTVTIDLAQAEDGKYYDLKFVTESVEAGEEACPLTNWTVKVKVNDGAQSAYSALTEGMKLALNVQDDDTITITFKYDPPTSDSSDAGKVLAFAITLSDDGVAQA